MKITGEEKNRPGTHYASSNEDKTEFTPASRTKLRADKTAGVIEIDTKTLLTGVPPLAWEYKLGNRSALEWILDQYKERRPKDATIAGRFNTYKFEDYKDEVIDLLKKVTNVSVRTMEIINQMPKE
ncbi:MAG TPA: type ISP restriction/modification enzyme [Pyrinomonadaceae bacterium]